MKKHRGHSRVQQRDIDKSGRWLRGYRAELPVTLVVVNAWLLGVAFGHVADLVCDTTTSYVTLQAHTLVTYLHLPTFVRVEDQRRVKPNYLHKVISSHDCKACQHL
jgi:hypothetical protein